MKTSSELTVGNAYSRIELANRFEIKDATLKTGIFQPPNHESIWLFVTEKKTADATQYLDHLDGDELSWDGQTSGRKDDSIINHEANGQEILLFYRQSKSALDNYSFRYEGPFRYVSHNGSNPAHFLLRRVGTSDEGPVLLRVVENPQQVGSSMLTFNQQASAYADRASNILRHTQYWVFHPSSGMFGPGKFVGFADMNFHTYEQANLGNSQGAKFDGHVTKNAIESATSAGFKTDTTMHDGLRDWGKRLLGENAYGNADPAKWQFVKLDTEIPDQANEEETVIDALERQQARGQGFVVDSKLRKTIEMHAMDAAKRYFESLNFIVEDHSKNHPYDLLCKRDKDFLYVEVKGTLTKGDEVILTSGEVDFARLHKPQMALFILHSIRRSGEGADITLREGISNVFLPWNVDDGCLEPTSFLYGLPTHQA